MLLLKFFSKKEYLNDFLDGSIYCKHPAFYRRLNSKGVGDRFESCQHFSEGRGQLDMIKVAINGRTLTYDNGFRSITIGHMDCDDYYLHCWFGAASVSPQNEPLILFNNVNQVASEFGDQYIVSVPPENLLEFFKRMRPLECEKIGFVEYSDNPHNWGNFCKSASYKYQSEFRFLYKPKKTSLINTEDQSFIVYAPEGFRDIVEVIDISEIKLHINLQLR